VAMERRKIFVNKGTDSQVSHGKGTEKRHASASGPLLSSEASESQYTVHHCTGREVGPSFLSSRKFIAWA